MPGLPVHPMVHGLTYSVNKINSMFSISVRGLAGYELLALGRGSDPAQGCASPMPSM